MSCRVLPLKLEVGVVVILVEVVVVAIVPEGAIVTVSFDLASVTAVEHAIGFAVLGVVSKWLLYLPMAPAYGPSHCAVASVV